MEETVHVWCVCRHVSRHLMHCLLIAWQKHCSHGCMCGYGLRYNVVHFKYIANMLSKWVKLVHFKIVWKCMLLKVKFNCTFKKPVSVTVHSLLLYPGVPPSICSSTTVDTFKTRLVISRLLTLTKSLSLLSALVTARAVLRCRIHHHTCVCNEILFQEYTVQHFRRQNDEFECRALSELLYASPW